MTSRRPLGPLAASVALAAVAGVLLAVPAAHATDARPGQRPGQMYAGHARLVASTGATAHRDTVAPSTDLVVDNTQAGTLVTVRADGAPGESVGSGLQFSYGVAVDAQGTYYATDGIAGTVVAFPAGGEPVTLATGLSSPNGIAVETDGDLVVGEYGAGRVVEIPAGGGAPVVLLSGGAYAGVAVADDGTIFASSTDGVVVELPVGGVVADVASGLGFATGVSIAPDGSLYVADYLGNTVRHVTLAGETTVVGEVGAFAAPHRTSVDDDGNLFVVQSSAGTVVEVPADGSATRTVATGLTNPLDVVTDDLVAPPVVDPTITAALSSPVAATSYGWFSSPVTVTFTCTEGTSPIVGGCPSPITVSRRSTARVVTRTVTASDGGTATVSSDPINLDRTRPTLKVVRRDGRLRCLAQDARSGIASCTTTRFRRDGERFFTAVATDRAGWTRSTTGRVARVPRG